MRSTARTSVGLLIAMAAATSIAGCQLKPVETVREESTTTVKETTVKETTVKDTTVNETTTSLKVTTTPNGDMTRFEIPELSLTFDLPNGYVEADGGPEILFEARQKSSRSLISFAAGSPIDEAWDPRPGETINTIDVKGHFAVEVLDAAVKIPAPAVTNELVVNNGDQSFSVIFTVGDGDIDEVWAAFLESMQFS